MKIDEKHKKAALALARGWAHAETARLAGVSERTLSAWKTDPDFLRTIAEQHDEVTAARATSLTPLVIQFSEAVSHAGNALIAGLAEESPALRSNLKVLVEVLKDIMELERSDIPSRNQQRFAPTVSPGLNAPEKDTIPECEPWRPTTSLGLTDAGKTPPKPIRDAESKES